jgi:stress-induced morphogen
MNRSSRDAQADPAVRQVLEVLGEYNASHRDAKIEAYRQNSASVRVRIIDPEFQGVDRIQRENLVWTILERLPESIQTQITLLLLLTPQEAEFSFTNLEFENPIPSGL